MVCFLFASPAAGVCVCVCVCVHACVCVWGGQVVKPAAGYRENKSRDLTEQTERAALSVELPQKHRE